MSIDITNTTKILVPYFDNIHKVCCYVWKRDSFYILGLLLIGLNAYPSCLLYARKIMTF